MDERALTNPCKNLVRHTSLHEDVPARLLTVVPAMLGLVMRIPPFLKMSEHESMRFEN